LLRSDSNIFCRIDEEERRRRLGLDHLDEDQLAELKRRTMMSFKDDLDRSQDFSKISLKLFLI